MEKAIIVLNFDDGRRIDNQVLQYMVQNNIPATFYINMGYVRKEFQIPATIAEPMSENELRNLESMKIFEIASHGYEHTNNWDSIERGVKALQEWKKEKSKTIGFSSPGSGLKESDILQNKKKVNEIGLSYIRLELRIQTHHLIRTAARKAARIIKSGFLYRIAYKETLMDQIENGICYCISALWDTRVQQLKAIVNESMKQKKVCAILFHSIASKEDKEYGDPWSWKKDKYLEFCEYLLMQRNAGKLELMTMEQAVQELEKVKNADTEKNIKKYRKSIEKI